MGLLFEWDGAKAASNLQKHAVSFEEATTIFGDPLSITIDSPQIKHGEQRYVTVGFSAAGQVLVVVHIDRNDRIRIISARKATGPERRQYENG